MLEVNPNPDLTESVSFMESAEQAGYSFSEALAWIVEFAAERKPEPLTHPRTTGDPASPVIENVLAPADRPDGPGGEVAGAEGTEAEPGEG